MLDFLSKLTTGKQAILEIMSDKENEIQVTELLPAFKLEELKDLEHENMDYLASLLYYYGLLTIARREINLVLEVPNRISNVMYLKKISKLLFPKPLNLANIHKQLFVKGDIKQVGEFLESIIKTLSNRDYIYNIKEMGYKLIFLSVFYRPDLYLIQSEPEIIRGYADLIYITRPDQRRLKIKDFVLELKYVEIKEVARKGKEVREMSKEELLENSAVQSKIKEAEEQIKAYKNALKEKYPELNFAKYVVIGIGFERVIGLEL